MARARSYPFQGTFNFRDVGGYVGLDGRTVRWGRLYRSDSLHRIDDADREAFHELGVRTVVDLRRPREVERDGRVPEYDGLAYHHIHPEHEEWGRYDPAETLERYLADRYADLAETGAAGIGAALTVIADPSNAPVVVHCVAGKDRTGIVCALTLALLGVDDGAVADDYALSTEASARFSVWIRETMPGEAELPPPFLSSPAAAMALFLADLRERYDGVEGYARHAGVAADEIASLRDHLLERSAT
jgi:protein tyrosine/serine phosphatase